MPYFDSLKTATVESEPFPHVVLEPALPDSVCDDLIREIPPLEVLSQGSPLGSNRRFSLPFHTASASPQVSDLWKSVLAEAVSQPFLDELFRLFGPAILETYPDFEKRFGSLESLRARNRHGHEPAKAGTIGVDAQIAVNTPVEKPNTSVRGPHLDRLEKLFIGLLYLRPEEDKSQGGNLELYRATDSGGKFLPKRMLPWDRVRAEKVVEYRRNALVLFLNTPEALHGVSPRSVTPHPRYFINLVAEVPSRLFSVECEVEDDPGDNWFEEAIRRAEARSWSLPARS